MDRTQMPTPGLVGWALCPDSSGGSEGERRNGSLSRKLSVADGELHWEDFREAHHPAPAYLVVLPSIVKAYSLVKRLGRGLETQFSFEELDGTHGVEANPFQHGFQ